MENKYSSIPNSKDKTNFITLLAVISCFAVVMLHINGCFWGDVKQPYWISANIIESLFYFAAPCFFMIAGATLIDYRDRYSTKEYFKKRALKTLLPYVIWSFIALLIRFCSGEIQGSDITIQYIISGLVNGNLLSIYWFFPVLFIMYLLIPIISFIPRENRQRILQYIIMIGFVICALIPFILNISKLNSSIVWPYVSSYIVGPFVYVALGYVLKNQKLNKRSEIIIYILGLAGFLTHCIGTYFLSINSGAVVQTFKGYYTPLCYFYSSAIFVLVKRISIYCMKGKFKSVVNYLSQYTFSIYLTHQFILNVILRLYDVAFHVNSTSLVYRLTAIFFIVPIIIVGTMIIRKIPIVKYILPK